MAINLEKASALWNFYCSLFLVTYAFLDIYMRVCPKTKIQVRIFILL